MKLTEVTHKKRSPAATQGMHALCAEIQRIFKWPSELVKMSGEYILEIKVPPVEDETEFEFAVKMLQKKLPSLIQKHIGEEWSHLEPRFIAPMMKAVRGYNKSITHKMASKGLTIKVRIV